MTGTITFGGIGSGIDTESIVTGLVAASSEQLKGLKSRATATRSAVSSMSDVASLLSKLKSSADALSDVRNAKSYTTTVTGDGVVATASGAALPGTFSVEVLGLAKEHRSYSDTFTSSTDSLSKSGTLQIAVGNSTPASIDVTTGDSLQTIADKINSAGIRASASVFFDGSVYRLQLRGSDTGAANAVTVTEAGTGLGLDNPANSFQTAADSRVKIDGFVVTRSTNQIVGAIQGVTLAVTAETTKPANVSVNTDPAALGTKLKGVVDAYNAIVSKVHTLAGFGKVAGTNTMLSGDSTLRSVTARMADAMLQTVAGTSKYQNLSSIGLSLGRDGMLSLDQTKLGTAMADDSTAVGAVLAGVGSGSGAMDVMRDLMTSLTQTGSGALALKQQSLEGRAKALDDRTARENVRIQRYAETLRKQFTAMDSNVAASHSTSSYLSRLYG